VGLRVRRRDVLRQIVVPVDEYREIRSHEDGFVIKPGHEKPDVERVVREQDGYRVVKYV
jgi:hypothetical protein